MRNPSSKIEINHGAGGRQMHQFINDCIISKLKNGILERLDDSAILQNHPHKKLAMTTDSYVVDPLFFPGGDIGRMAVSGTVNDLVTSGAIPYAMSLAFILEEGISFQTIEQIVDSIAETCKEAQIKIVTGDTKIVEKGKGDQIFINTCGIGFIDEALNISTYNAKVGDSVFVTGAIGNHEISLMLARKLINFDCHVNSDVAPLSLPTHKILSKTDQIRTIKDPTRGGLASALMEICDHSNCEIRLSEDRIPIDPEVEAVCNLVGYDPLYLANEGKFVMIAPQEIESLIRSAFPKTAQIGRVRSKGKSLLTLETETGGIRRLGMLETTQLPRIC